MFSTKQVKLNLSDFLLLIILFNIILNLTCKLNIAQKIKNMFD